MAMSFSHIKRKSVILPKGVATGSITNATNPSSLQKLMRAYTDKVNAEGTRLQEKGPPPNKARIPIDARYIAMGDAMGICPHELKAIMESHIGDDQALVFTLLKKFVTAVKLSGAVDLSPTHRKLREIEDSYREQMDVYAERCKAVDQRNRAIQDEIKAKQLAFSAAWLDILIDLKTKLDRNNDISSLGEWDRLMTMAIASKGDEFCLIVKDKATLDFQACKAMTPDDIINLPATAKQIQETEEEMRWQNWLSRASVNQLMKKLWEFGVEVVDEADARKREQIEWAIVAKSGRIPVRDRWGNLDWYSTFTGDDTMERPSYSYDDDYEKQELKKMLLAQMNSGVHRAKSGGMSKGKKKI